MTPQGRQGTNDSVGLGIVGVVVNAQAQPVQHLSTRQLPGTVSRRLAVVPRHHLPLIDMRLLHRLGQTVVVEECGSPIATQHQVAAKAGPEADWIDVEVGQVHQVGWIGQHQLVFLEAGAENLPQPLTPVPTPIRTEHVVFSLSLAVEPEGRIP